MVEAVGVNVYHLAHVTLRKELSIIITVPKVLVSDVKPLITKCRIYCRAAYLLSQG